MLCAAFDRLDLFSLSTHVIAVWNCHYHVSFVNISVCVCVLDFNVILNLAGRSINNIKKIRKPRVLLFHIHAPIYSFREYYFSVMFSIS